MGQITIDIPQHLEFNFRVIEKELAEELVLKLRKEIVTANAVGDTGAIWVDRPQSADEIADSLRRSWRRSLSNG